MNFGVVVLAVLSLLMTQCQCALSFLTCVYIACIFIVQQVYMHYINMAPFNTSAECAFESIDWNTTQTLADWIGFTSNTATITIDLLVCLFLVYF